MHWALNRVVGSGCNYATVLIGISNSIISILRKIQEEMADEEVDIERLTLQEKLDHKLWKARQRGYQDLQKELEEGILDPSFFDQLWGETGRFEQYIQDSNVVALESAVVALNSFLGKKISKIVDSGDDTIKTHAKFQVDAWVPVLIIKPLSSTRAATKKNAMECIIKLVSLMDSVDYTISAILTKLPSVIKQPKPTAAIINILNQILTKFQCNLLASADLLKQLLEPLPKLSSHADRNVRSETMNLIVTVFLKVDGFQNRALLDELLLNSLKPIQIKDMEKLIDKVKDQKPEIMPYVWEDVIAKNKQQFNVDEDGDTVMMGSNTEPKQDNTNNNVNALDSLVAGDTILDKFPDEFHSRVESQKWKDRAEALEEFYDHALSKLKKIDGNANENYTNLFSMYGHIISKDINVQVVTIAAESIDKICHALPKQKLTKHLIQLVFNPLLERTKEKKPTLLDAIRKTLKTLVEHSNPVLPHNEDMLQLILQYMEHKVPQIRMECTSLFNYVLQLEAPGFDIHSSYLVGEISRIVPKVVKIVNDTNPSIRQVGFDCFATLVTLLGKRPFIDSLDKLDTQKRKKIEELINSKSRPSSGALPGTRAGATSTVLPVKRPPTSPLKKPPTSTSPRSRVLLTSRSLTKPNFGGSQSAPVTELTTGTLTPNKRFDKAVDNGVQGITSNGGANYVSKFNSERERWDKERGGLLSSIKKLEDTNAELTARNFELVDKLTSFEKEREQQNLVINSKNEENGKLLEKIDFLEMKVKELQEKLDSNLSSARTFSLGTELSVPEAKRVVESSDDELPKRVNSLRINSRASTLSSSDQQLFSRQFSGRDDEESWKRAAEVTRKLKERIETMKARNRELSN